MISEETILDKASKALPLVVSVVGFGLIALLTYILYCRFMAPVDANSDGKKTKAEVEAYLDSVIPAPLNNVAKFVANLISYVLPYDV